MFLKDEGKSIKYEEKETNEGRWFHSQTQRPQFTLSTSNGCNCQTTCAHRTTHLKARSFRSISLRPRNEPNPYNKSLHIERETPLFLSLQLPRATIDHHHGGCFCFVIALSPPPHPQSPQLHPTPQPPLPVGSHPKDTGFTHPPWKARKGHR